MDVYVDITDSFFCAAETSTILEINITPIKKKFFFFFKESMWVGIGPGPNLQRTRVNTRGKVTLPEDGQ